MSRHHGACVPSIHLMENAGKPKKRRLLLEPGLLVVVGVLLCLLLGWFVVLFLQLSAAFPGRSVTDQEAWNRWSRNEAEYRAMARVYSKISSEGEVKLPPALGHLTKDGTVYIVKEDGRKSVTFLLDTWGIDNSIAIVYVDGKTTGIEHGAGLEKWARQEKLADGWLLVEGT